MSQRCHPDPVRAQRRSTGSLLFRPGLRPLPTTMLLDDAVALLSDDPELATLFVEQRGELCGAIPRDLVLAIARQVGEKEFDRVTLGALLGPSPSRLAEVA